MPALAEKIVADLRDRLLRYLEEAGGHEEVAFLNAGGSAAVFKVKRDGNVRAVKVFSAELFNGPGGAADKRRLDVQRRLIGHACPTLVQTYAVVEAIGTAFMEMEYVEWPQLTDVLANVPDEAIASLITQLVSAVKFLESQNIVHRDIKPENIHVSTDFKNLKLLDLGVARDFDAAEINDAAVTDHGEHRPFLATAQYSSPEYLFRLDEPTIKLWKGLNFYQIGAVLHDLIKKEPLFLHEMQLGNRWLVARAVLTKTPMFNDPLPGRLAQLKALASRCLVKDLDARLQLVGWEDFILEGASEDPLNALRARLAKGVLNAGGKSSEALRTRLDFERMEFLKRLMDRVRSELIPTCGNQLPITTKMPSPGEQMEIKFLLSVDKAVTFAFHLAFEWMDGVYERSVNLTMAGRIVYAGSEQVLAAPTYKAVCVATIQEGEDEAVTTISNEIARLTNAALDLVEAAGEKSQLHGVNLIID